MNIQPAIPHKSLDLAQMNIGERGMDYTDRSIMGEAFTPQPLPDLPEPLSFESRIGHRKLGIQATSWQAPDALVYFPGWGGTFESPITKLEIDHIAAELPSDTDVIRVNLPGHGEEFRSSRWPRSVIKDISRGYFFSAGEYIAPFLDTEICGRKTLSIAGTSFGGRIALALAHVLERPIDTLAMFDPPGDARQTLSEFKQTYRQKEGEAAEIYCRESPDEHLQMLTRSSPRHSLPAKLGRLIRGSLLQYYYQEPSGMAAGTFTSELKAANLQNVKRLAVLSPSQSYLNSVQNINTVLCQVYDNQIAKNKVTTAVEHWTFPGTHAITRYSSNMLGLLYGSIFRHKTSGSGQSPLSL